VFVFLANGAKMVSLFARIVAAKKLLPIDVQCAMALVMSPAMCAKVPAISSGTRGNHLLDKPPATNLADLWAHTSLRWSPLLASSGSQFFADGTSCLAGDG